MSTIAFFEGRSSGFRFRLLREGSKKGGKLHIASPSGKHATVKVSEGQFRALEFLRDVFQLDIVDPDIDAEEAGRRLVETIAMAVHLAQNTVSKYLGKLLKQILEKATDAFPDEVERMPLLVTRVTHGENRGHRLNVDLTIEWKAKPADGSREPPQPPPGPVCEQPKSQIWMMPAPPLESGQWSSGLGNAPSPPPVAPDSKSEQPPSELKQESEQQQPSDLNMLPLPPPEELQPEGDASSSNLRSAQAEGKSWSATAGDRKKDRNRPDNSGQTPA